MGHLKRSHILRLGWTSITVIDNELEKCTKSISNTDEAIEKALILSSKLSMVCHSSDTDVKVKIQNLVFPEGIVYD
ncbi:hypothetical protein [[Flexibacter] sp. ATCC 35208]|uniref:hypothetical protein n=1 Tax=[Flexibacter] sp. ATCC 35208 TaxID=1936242 RepID=UPI0009CA2897|nr:hypothetical protein [[Flexibacter] sp. ATCC 35208]OMP74669.1 hypothetical protein BW716_34160 [[Flexibacter] sp. ATCC 35208]